MGGLQRTLQAERVGDAGGRRFGDPGHRPAVQRGQLGVVAAAARADEDAGVAADQHARLLAPGQQCLHGDLQQQAVLRVHQLRVPDRDAEQLRVEEVDVLQEAALAVDDFARRARVGVICGDEHNGQSAARSVQWRRASRGTVRLSQGSQSSSASQRSVGTFVTASTPEDKVTQKSSVPSAPGIRHATPTTAIREESAAGAATALSW